MSVKSSGAKSGSGGKPSNPRLARLLESDKDGSRLLSAARRHSELTRAERDADRRQDVLHPSEMAKPDWCPRRDFYRITLGVVPEDYGFRTQNIFDEGHTIHDKWQGRFWDMGILGGVFMCLLCWDVVNNDAPWHKTDGYLFDATAPAECPRCGAGREFLRYREVPLENPTLNIAGHADGDINDGGEPAMLEVKSIGIGTVRMEHPKLLNDHTKRITDAEGKAHTWVDWEGLWRNIKRPFPSHLVQGNIYLYLHGRKVMIFLYECKWNQEVKEFTVRYSPRLIEELLDDARDVVYALKQGRPPRRPSWADEKDSTCKACPFYGTCWEVSSDQTPSGAQPKPARRARPTRGEGRGRAGREEPGVAGSTERREEATEAPRRPQRPARRRPDGVVREAHPVGGLLGRRARPRRDS